MTVVRTMVVVLLAAGMLAVPAAGHAGASGVWISPPKANDWSCRPSVIHPYPVVLVHGTGAPALFDWASLSPMLSDQGYCVFSIDYGNFGTGPIEDSAGQLAAFVDQVLAATGATKVAIVGHSQGGTMPRYYMRFLGGASKVSELIALAPSSHGTSHPLYTLAALVCLACRQQGTSSEFISRLNEGGEVEPGVDYTVISTRYDEVVIPYTSQALSGPPSQVTNIVVQDKCPNDLVEHMLMSYDPAVAQWVANALARPGPADPAFQPAC